MEIYFIRHAETEWNKIKRFQGWHDSPLTQAGIEQAKQLGKRLKPIKFQAVFISPLLRCIDTFKNVETQLDCHPLSYIDERLKEINCGVWEGKLRQEIENEFPDENKIWVNSPGQHKMPGGESVKDVASRVLPFIDEIIKSAQNTIAVVSHTITINCILCHLLDVPLNNMWQEFKQVNTSLNIVKIADGKVIHMIKNDISHLSDTKNISLYP